MNETFLPPVIATDDTPRSWVSRLCLMLGGEIRDEDDWNDIEAVQLNNTFPQGRWYTTEGGTCFLVTKDAALADAVQRVGCGLVRPFQMVRGGEPWWDLNLPAYLVPLIR